MPASDVREDMEVIAADGTHIGIVDRVEGDRIKLTRKDSPQTLEGEGGRHHYLPVGLIAAVEDHQVRLSANGSAVTELFEE